MYTFYALKRQSIEIFVYSCQNVALWSAATASCSTYMEDRDIITMPKDNGEYKYDFHDSTHNHIVVKIRRATLSRIHFNIRYTNILDCV